MKEDSALGRILVWKVTLSTPHPHASLLWGNGIGYFESQYGKWQADYFREKEGTEKERHIAGYVTTAYNEFLELGLEQGIIVTACIAALLVMATGTGWKNLSTIELGAKASIVSITILMFCSYPLKVLPTTLYLMFCLSVALYGKNAVAFHRTSHDKQRCKIPCWSPDLRIRTCRYDKCIRILFLSSGTTASDAP